MPVAAFQIRRPSDFHVHVRSGEMLSRVATPSLMHNMYALIMPNVDPPIANWHDAQVYEGQINYALNADMVARPKLVMALYLTRFTTPDDIRTAKQHHGAYTCVKYYPFNTTTMSQFGIERLTDGYRVFEAMEEENVVLCLHGEVAGMPSYPEAEQRFILELAALIERFSRLRIVVEHVSSADMVHFLWDCSPKVAGTITPQHMVLTIDDVERGGEVIYPHNACLPRAKTAEDRWALTQAAATSIDSVSPRFFLGTDSAPHMPEKKYAGPGCANGVYSGPVALPVLAQLFELSQFHNWRQRLEYFASLAGPLFYGLEPPEASNKVTLLREEWRVPNQINGVVPFLAGQTIQWKLRDDRAMGHRH